MNLPLSCSDTSRNRLSSHFEERHQSASYVYFYYLLIKKNEKKNTYINIPFQSNIDDHLMTSLENLNRTNKFDCFKHR